jgi:hypothetical protein
MKVFDMDSFQTLQKQILQVILFRDLARSFLEGFQTGVISIIATLSNSSRNMLGC